MIEKSWLLPWAGVIVPRQRIFRTINTGWVKLKVGSPRCRCSIQFAFPIPAHGNPIQSDFDFLVNSKFSLLLFPFPVLPFPVVLFYVFVMCHLFWPFNCFLSFPIHFTFNQCCSRSPSPFPVILCSVPLCQFHISIKSQQRFHRQKRLDFRRFAHCAILSRIIKQ